MPSVHLSLAEGEARGVLLQAGALQVPGLRRLSVEPRRMSPVCLEGCPRKDRDPSLQEETPPAPLGLLPTSRAECPRPEEQEGCRTQDPWPSKPAACQHPPITLPFFI